MPSTGFRATYTDPTDGESPSSPPSDDDFVVVDDECVAGWDDGLGTYFFQSGFKANCETDEPLIWIGSSPGEYQDVESFLDALQEIVEVDDVADLRQRLLAMKND